MNKAIAEALCKKIRAQRYFIELSFRVKRLEVPANNVAKATVVHAFEPVS